MCRNELLKYLLDKLINENGKGHEELQKYLSSGEITKEDAEILKIKANIRLLDANLDAALIN